MFKQYLRYETGEPFGVVLVDENKFGWSLCSPLDRFNKRRAEIIAKGRAHSDVNWLDVLKKKGPFFKKCEIDVKRNGGSVRYGSKVEAVIDKIEYLKEKLKISP